MAGERRARGRQDGPGLKGRRDHARWIGLFTICSSSLRTTSPRGAPCGRRHGVDKSRHPGKLRCDAFPSQPFRPSMPSVWHAAHLRVSHIQGLHPCVPSPPRHDALATAHHPRALACVLRLQPRCAQRPSFSLVGPASLSRSNRRGLAVVRWKGVNLNGAWRCLLYTSPSPRDKRQSRMPSSA